LKFNNFAKLRQNFLIKRWTDQFEYVNLGYLEEISGGDTNFQKELIGIFLTQIPEFITNMHKFLIEKEIEELAKEAHTAKSSVLIFMMEETGKN
jgi:HPt (histidine-containing phosphotransfer) domain-containing protein